MSLLRQQPRPVRRRQASCPPRQRQGSARSPDPSPAGPGAAGRVAVPVPLSDAAGGVWSGTATRCPHPHRPRRLRRRATRPQDRSQDSRAGVAASIHPLEGHPALQLRGAPPLLRYGAAQPDHQGGRRCVDGAVRRRCAVANASQLPSPTSRAVILGIARDGVRVFARACVCARARVRMCA